MALIAGLRGRGLRVQPFKVGPDYLDPQLLSWAAGRPCRNLDGWMLPPMHLLELFQRACRGADIAVVEGVMGLFDGKSGAGDEASTAAIARLLDAPVILILDAARASRTVGAVGLGLSRADPRLNVAGAVLNRVASERHRDACVEGLTALGVPSLGHLFRREQFALPDRYLGLVSPAESEPRSGMRQALEQAAAGLDLDGLVREARVPPGPDIRSDLFPAMPVATRARIAIALDRAFHFYYRDSLDLLEAWGAELVPFSPLESPMLPAGVGGVYLGGGYPELFAAELASNTTFIRSLQSANRRGALVYAECGGAMYASRAIEDEEGRRRRMAGLWPVAVSLKRRRLTVGYRRVRACSPSFLARLSSGVAPPHASVGQSPTREAPLLELPAHEFHYSQLLHDDAAEQPAWLVLDEQHRAEGYATPRLAASYIHLHLGSQPGLASIFVDACRPAS
jgi:cobyrinic acid a,c-diamide synthase